MTAKRDSLEVRTKVAHARIVPLACLPWDHTYAGRPRRAIILETKVGRNVREEAVIEDGQACSQHISWR